MVDSSSFFIKITTNYFVDLQLPIGIIHLWLAIVVINFDCFFAAASLFIETLQMLICRSYHLLQF